MSDEEIDYSDIPPLSEDFFKRAKVWRPRAKVTVRLEVDEDVLDWFKAESDDWKVRIGAALRLYAEIHKGSPA